MAAEVTAGRQLTGLARGLAAFKISATHGAASLDADKIWAAMDAFSSAMAATGWTT